MIARFQRGQIWESTDGEALFVRQVDPSDSRLADLQRRDGTLEPQVNAASLASTWAPYPTAEFALIDDAGDILATSGTASWSDAIAAMSWSLGSPLSLSEGNPGDLRLCYRSGPADEFRGWIPVRHE